MCAYMSVIGNVAAPAGTLGSLALAASNDELANIKRIATKPVSSVRPPL